MADLSTELCGIRFKNPVWTASGCFGYGREFADVFPLSELGAICVKGTAPEPWVGNKGTRVVETPGGMLNAIGLQNPGIDYFLNVDWPWLREQGATVIVNIVGRTVAEYVAVARRLEGSGVAAVELNISCPNVKEGGLAFGTSLKGAAEVTAAVRKATSLPLMVKLSPNVTNIVDFAKAVEDAGADAVTLINTLLGMSVDIRKRKPVLGNLFGGLSGPGVKPVALRMVWQVAGAVKIPVVGIGGIMTGADAVEFLMAGARAVQVGTACFVNPRAPIDVINGIAAFMAETGVSRVADLVGAARPAAGAEGNLPALGREAGTKPAKVATGETADALRQFMKDSDRF
ncbi:MAG: dihydroorotate dehydrogenase catalytic subunit [Firmicutes bacterium]|nr:dihydroorotate dehydrogenase catalytic subunit [Bacillota bacterium]